ncbi:MAG: GDSL-type esterase/lipase family protein [Candidatus Electrothrix aestuarii]|uniref:GDSL-type esterase/lipase family protein n=1 Tax=Candidatus Electrothrix aestuarii TaxID=3062594 RepID=A0AAU8LVI2_9BACT|nr:GDSL-type esterase/lipase family protein [Candidatus Electrothrix aestuarii]
MRLFLLSKLTILLLTTLLAASLLLCFALFKQGKQFYRRLNATQLDPIGLSFFPVTPASILDKQKDAKRLVFFGDSRIEQWTQPKIAGYEILNRGIGGQTSTQILMRYDAHVRPLAPDILLIQAGINDLKTIALFPEQRDKILADLQENLAALTQRAVDQGITVLLTTIFPVGKVPLARKLFWSKDVEAAIVKVNTFISSLQAKNILVFDAYSILVGEDGKIRPQYSRDLLHLNQEGYKVLNRELGQFIANLSVDDTAPHRMNTSSTRPNAQNITY